MWLGHYIYILILDPGNEKQCGAVARTTKSTATRWNVSFDSFNVPLTNKCVVS